jgi:succinate dehydrogenase/fumarate reductase flavoprotein subunit
MKASDAHQLMRAHEVEATLLTTEMVLQSALLRTESRAGHYREDYPKTDTDRLHRAGAKIVAIASEDEIGLYGKTGFKLGP